MFDTRRLKLAIAAVGMASGPGALAQTAPGTTHAAPATIDTAQQYVVINAVIAKIGARYVFPDKVPGVASVLRRKLKAGGYAGVTDPAAFARTVTADIGTITRDKHMQLFWSAKDLPPFGDAAKADPTARAKRAQELARINYALPRVEILDGNIGYLKIDGFVPADDGGETLAAAMAFLRHSDALIVDLRDNGGGEPGMVALALSYLVPAETHIDSFHQRGKTIDDQIWALPHVPGGRWSVDKPVYVLTSADTASAAEEFAYDIQQLKRGVIVGASTWGGANPGDMVAIDTHFAMFIPTGAAVNPVSKTNWEGVGVKPDVATDPKAALDTARRLAIEKLVASADPVRGAELRKLLSPTS